MKTIRFGASDSDYEDSMDCEVAICEYCGERFDVCECEELD
jgi:hypothetical protein